jgi:hypothetical protein
LDFFSLHNPSSFLFVRNHFPIFAPSYGCVTDPGEKSVTFQPVMIHVGNLVLSAVCGFLFAAAWWMFVDGTALADVKGDNAGPAWIYFPGILATIGLFLVSNLPPSMFQKENSEESSTLQKTILLLAVMCKSAAVIVAVWCYIAKEEDRVGGYKEWRGISVILQAITISCVSFAWNFLYQDPGAY